MTDIRHELLAAFDAEHREHLAVVRAALAAADAGAAIDLKDVFRRVHSLKGAARAVDLATVEEIAHRLEAFFAAVVDGTAVLSAPARAIVEEALDGVEREVAVAGRAFLPGEAGGDRSPAETRALLARLAALPGVAAGDGPATVPDAPPPDPSSSRPAASAPSLPAEPMPAGVPAADGDGGRTEYVRVSARRIQALDAALAMLAGEGGGEATLVDGLRDLDGVIAAVGRSLEAARRAAGPGEAGEAVRFRLGEAEAGLRSAGRALRSLRLEARRRGFAAGQAIRRVEEAARAVTLVGADTVFGDFGRIVRDLARDAGLPVSFLAEGLDLPVDRRLLQALKDPVLHALRNAVSHGRESPAERQAAGKPADLTVTLAVAVRGGRLQVTVSDDGRGPDLARIEAVARRAGLIAAGEGRPSAERLLRLVFEPGFSTAGRVDRLSGRGMGLSVVAEAVRREQGAARLERRRPAGSRLVIEVPLAARLQATVVVEAAGSSFGLPAHGIERLMRLPAGALQRVDGRPVVWIETGGRDVAVPVVSLATLIGPSTMPIPLPAGFARLVLLRRGDQRLALAVDALDDAAPMKVESLAGFPGDARLVAGAVLSGDRPVVVLDPDGLIDRLLAGAGGAGAEPVESAEDEAATAPTVLVVDDSITMRTLGRSILEAQGYRVLVAVDGLDALNTIRSGTAAVDLVMADVEMPRMDGFALLGALRNDARFAGLPVVMMTSRAAPEDVARGLELGANAYVTKQRFDQRELLAIIGRLIG